MKILDFIYENLYGNDKFKHTSAPTIRSKKIVERDLDRDLDKELKDMLHQPVEQAEQKEAQSVLDESNNQQVNSPSAKPENPPMEVVEKSTKTLEVIKSVNPGRLKKLITFLKDELGASYSGCIISEKGGESTILLNDSVAENGNFSPLAGVVRQINNLIKEYGFPEINDFVLFKLANRHLLFMVNLEKHQLGILLKEVNIGLLTGVLLPEIKKYYINAKIQ